MCLLVHKCACVCLVITLCFFLKVLLTSNKTKHDKTDDVLLVVFVYIQNDISRRGNISRFMKIVTFIMVVINIRLQSTLLKTTLLKKSSYNCFRRY